MLRKIKSYLYPNNKEHCKFCGNRLKEYEKIVYGSACEKCERRILEKMQKQC